MPDEQEECPKLEFKDIKPMEGELKLKLDCAEPVKTGTTKYGDWSMWFGFVEDMKVHKGRKPNEEVVEKFTGKVIFFPTERFSAKLIELADGKVGAEVLIKHVAKQGKVGLYSEYTVEKLADGKVVGESLTPYEAKLVTDARGLIANGYALTEDALVQSSKEEMYGGQISEARAKELFHLIDRE